MLNQKMKKTLVFGASPNPNRYSYHAVSRLLEKGYEIIPLGIRKGSISGKEIIQGIPPLENIHTITLYINPNNQIEYYDYILSLNPKRIIFNPGTENPVLVNKAKEQGIEVEIACTLVLLSVGNY